MGQAVSIAVGRFVAVGEAIAAENQELKDEMGQACFEARRAGMLFWTQEISAKEILSSQRGIPG